HPVKSVKLVNCMAFYFCSRTLFLGSALILVSATPALAQQTTSGMGDDLYNAADAAGFDASDSPAIIIDDASDLVMDISVGANNGNHMIEIQNGAGSLTINQGVLISTGGTGDVVNSG